MELKRLYVGNLPYSANEEDMLAHFAPYQPSNPRIIAGRGFGFIDIAADKLDEAIEAKHNSEMGGRNLTVNEARPPGSGGGGGGGRDFRSGGGGGRDFSGGGRDSGFAGGRDNGYGGGGGRGGGFGGGGGRGGAGRSGRGGKREY